MRETYLAVPRGDPMANKTSPTIADFTATELKNMLAAKKAIDKLAAQKAKIEKQLAKVEREIEKLLSSPLPRLKKKPGRKKAAKKKIAKKAPRKARTSPSRRPTVELVVVDLLKANGSPMAFKDILATIQKKKLVKTKSKNFANVLRRTLSVSTAIKRAGRGIYFT